MGSTPLRVGVVITPWYYWHRPCAHQPLTHLYLATLIAEHFSQTEVQVDCIDLRARSERAAAQDLPERDLYLYSLATPDWPVAQALVAAARRRYPAGRHVAGGAHVSVFPDASSRVMDTIVTGAAEGVLPRLVRDACRGHLRRRYAGGSGRSWRAGPFPCREFLPDRVIVSKRQFKTRVLPSTEVLWQRGCPYRCAFCANLQPRRPQVRTVQLRAAETAYLKRRYGVRGLSLLDEMALPLAEAEALRWTEELGTLDIAWRGQTRVGVTRRAVRAARASGCCELAFGVESADPQVLRRMRKGITLAAVERTLAWCHEEGIRVQLCLVLGLPGERRDIVARTRQLITRLQPDVVMLSLFCPYPGSPVYRAPQTYGIAALDGDFRRYAHLLHRFGTEEMTAGLPFRYARGKGPTRARILAQAEELQAFLRDTGRVR